jgi:acid stress-induced BolA-like protein IbaG/YrbA
MPEREEIGLRFQSNLERVRGLVTLYETLAPEKPGRRPVPFTDLLRAAVVFLHATLEDLLRSTLEWKLPSAPGDLLKGIPLTGMTDQKFTLSELAEYRGDATPRRSVMDMKERVKKILEQLELNNPQVNILEESGAGILAQVVSDSFQGMEDWERQRLVWSKLLEDLGDDKSRWVEFVFTDTPSALAEDMAAANEAEAETKP